MNSQINGEFKISEKYKNMCSSRIREIENTIIHQQLPRIDRERNVYEKDLMQDVLKF